MAQKFGTTSWDEETGRAANNSGGKKDAFLRLEQGTNVVRVITSPHAYAVHKYKEEGDDGFGDSVMCSKPLHGSCPLCSIGDKVKQRWYVGVIDRKTNSYKVLDFSVVVYDQLKTLNRDEDYGAPIKYDIDIKVNKNAGAAGYYTVVPKPPRPLSESDLALKAAADEEALDRRCQPPTPEWVLSRVNTLREKKGKGPLAVGAPPAPAAKRSAPLPPVDAGNDGDFDFPAVDG